MKNLIDLGPDFGASVSPETAAIVEAVTVREAGYDKKGQFKVRITFQAKSFPTSFYGLGPTVIQPQSIESFPLSREAALAARERVVAALTKS